MKRAKKRGVFLVIEGGDGSGKTTQLAELAVRLRKQGIEPQIVDFPQYAKPSSYFVKEYLNGRYGTASEVGPYRSSIFYAVDRFDIAPQIREWLENGEVVLSNRYVSSNMAHQGGKIANSVKRKKYFKWLDELEHGIFNIPRPTATIILHVPASVSQELVDKKGSREYIGGVKRDLHESDIKHLRRAEETYLEMTKLFPKSFKIVECAGKGKLLSIQEIHEKVWEKVQPIIIKNSKTGNAGKRI
jgi:dTMP kinase